MIQVLCMYCQAPIRTIEEPEQERIAVSHGVCRNCLPRLLKESGVPIAKFLDRLATPVLVMDRDVRVLAANAAAEAWIGKTHEDVTGVLCGNVIGCGHTDEPGGCGKTVHCLSCTIQQSVKHTIRTGESCRDVPAYSDLGLLSGDKTVSLHISTEKRDGFVLLRIDRVDGKPAGGVS